LSQLAVR